MQNLAPKGKVTLPEWEAGPLQIITKDLIQFL